MSLIYVNFLEYEKERRDVCCYNNRFFYAYIKVLGMMAILCFC
ncbi:hypothetical protein OKW21_003809 [Catalinimonas alkaloidigena]|nr:hypothetical protein [Catalinimonas alkaloidigena]